MPQPVREKRWVLRNAEAWKSEAELEQATVELADKHDLGVLTARAMLLRGVRSDEEVRVYLKGGLAQLPEPNLFSGMQQAVDRLTQALENGEKLAVFGDYDVDGITGTALLTEALRAMGAEVDYHIPLRLKDGYGLSADAIRAAVASGCRAAISVDCGISAHAEAQLARELGLELIITDHHHAPDELPVATAIVNPQVPGDAFPFKDLSGVGVAFFVMIALRRHLRQRGYFEQRDRAEPDLKYLVDLVAMGTVADVVPLHGVNRILTRVGLPLLSAGQRPGVAALKRVAGVAEVTAGAVGFRLAPRLNAAGRIEDAGKGAELLLLPDPNRAAELADELDGFNVERKRIETETLSQAIDRIDNGGEGGDYAIVLADERWHPGVIGIVASRLVERYHRPTVLIALDAAGKGKGSARSIRGFHLFHGMQECAEHLLGFGGHEYAAGCSIDGAKVADFAKAMDEVAKRRLRPEDLIPAVSFDGHAELSGLSLRVVENLDMLAPFGAGNPAPTFVARGLQAEGIRVVGEKHLSFTARQGGATVRCIAFGMAERIGELQATAGGPTPRIDILFEPGVNEYRNVRNVQAEIRDFKLCGAL